MNKISFADYLKDYLEINNISNKDFSKRIGITQKHLIDILSKKKPLSFNVIDSISLVTGIPSDYIYRTEQNYRLEKTIENYLKKDHLSESEFLNKFKYKYLIDNKWIDFTNVNDKLEIIKDILKFLRVNEPSKIYQIDSFAYYKSKNDKIELLLLWLEKCYKETLTQKLCNYTKDSVNNLVDYISKAAKSNKFNEKDLINEFNKNGVALVIQEDIPGSKIRGALKVHKDKPAIYLTYKHKRIGDVYFALLHELAHLKTDYNKAKANSIVTHEDSKEVIADNQAYNWMVDNKYYDSIANNDNYDINLESKYPKSFVVYRLAADKRLGYSSKEYQRYNTPINLVN